MPNRITNDCLTRECPAFGNTLLGAVLLTKFDKKMEYLKIAEIANKCEVKRQLISEHYRMIGANIQFTDEVRNVFYAMIKDMERDLKVLEDKLRKYVK